MTDVELLVITFQIYVDPFNYGQTNEYNSK